MAITRTLLAHVSGHLKFGASTYIYSESPIEVNLVTKHNDISVDGLGRVRKAATDRYLEITCKPNEFEGYAALMTPYAAMDAGTSIFGATDTALIFYGRDGKSRTFHSAAVTGFGIVGKAGSTLLNTLTFTALLANNKSPGDAGAYFTEATLTYPGDTNYSRSAAITPALSCVWGAAPFDAFHVQDGLDIAFALALEPDVVDGLGTVDMKFQDCIVNASGIPVGMTATELYTAADMNTVMGAAATENDLILSGTGFHFTAYGAMLTDPKVAFSASKRVPGQVVWTTNRSQTAGTKNPCFRLAAAAP
jgi:hypothetical protein